MSVSGVDVSDVQQTVDWAAVAEAGVGFALAKATEGITFVAKTFATNWAGIRAAGLIRGTYHYFRPRDDAQAQVDNFLGAVRPGPGDLPPALDVEVWDGVGAETVIERMQQWLNAVEAATGRKPLIYTYPGFWQDLGNPDGFSDYPLWIANYGRSTPTIPSGWGTYTIWQYTDGGKVSGIAVPVDLNFFNGSLDELTSFATSGQAPSAEAAVRDFWGIGDTGAEVREIQTQLSAKGFDPGAIDGVFGPRVKAAVTAFQTSNNLVVDGFVNAQTLARLRE